jgi:perosamine synthetase
VKKDSGPSGNFIHQVEPYITERERNAVAAYLESGGWLTEHEKTREFERMIAEFVGTKHAVALPSGTTALYLALLASGIHSGHSVIVPDYTMIATPNSAKWAGADVILTDVRRDTMCLDFEKVKLRSNTAALMYVSTNGRADRLDEVVEFCDKHGLVLIEDAAQSMGSRWKGKCLGTFGEVGVFSFTPHKIITTGQGGAIVTNSKQIYEKVKGLKDFCRVAPGHDNHTGIGYNFKFTDLQAIIGIEQLKIIDYRIRSRRGVFKWYREALGNIVEFLETDLKQVVPWFVDVLLDVPREKVIQSLRKNSIGSRPFYPPIHSQIPYRKPDHEFRVTTSICPRGLWLPSSIGTTQETMEYVADKVKEVVTGLKVKRPI